MWALWVSEPGGPWHAHKFDWVGHNAVAWPHTDCPIFSYFSGAKITFFHVFLYEFYNLTVYYCIYGFVH